jgi:hypothetical protein
MRRLLTLPTTVARSMAGACNHYQLQYA